MSRKPPKKGLSEPEVEYRHEDPFHEPEIEPDAWIARNRDAFLAGMDEARAQAARGEGLTLGEAMAELRARAARRRARRT